MNGSTVKQQPFICMVAGCMRSKWQDRLVETHFRKMLNLPSIPHLNAPSGEYRQWQPMYLNMIKTIRGIELNEGILSNIDNNGFLDASKSNGSVRAGDKRYS